MWIQPLLNTDDSCYMDTAMIALFLRPSRALKKIDFWRRGTFRRPCAQPPFLMSCRMSLRRLGDMRGCRFRYDLRLRFLAALDLLDDFLLFAMFYLKVIIIYFFLRPVHKKFAIHGRKAVVVFYHVFVRSNFFHGVLHVVKVVPHVPGLGVHCVMMITPDYNRP